MAANAHQTAALRSLVIKVEATPGTDSVPATANHIIRFRDIDIQPNIEFDDNTKYANGGHAEDPSLAGVNSCTITASVRCTYGGGDTTEPQWWLAAKACGCEATAAYATTKGIGLVRNASEDDATYSMYVIDQTVGRTPVYTIYKVAGAMGNMVLSQEIGGPMIASFTFTGKLTDIVDGSTIAINASTQTELAQVFTSANFQIGTVSTKVSSWQFDLGNEIQPVYDQNDATGISHYIIASSKPRFSCNPLAVAQATTDIHNLVNSNGQVLIETQEAASGKLSLHIIEAQYLSPALSAREGLVNWDLNFKACQNGVPGTPANAVINGGTLEDTFELLNGTRS